MKWTEHLILIPTDWMMSCVILKQGRLEITKRSILIKRQLIITLNQRNRPITTSTPNIQDIQRKNIINIIIKHQDWRQKKSNEGQKSIDLFCLFVTIRLQKALGNCVQKQLWYIFRHCNSNVSWSVWRILADKKRKKFRLKFWPKYVRCVIVMSEVAWVYWSC